MDTLVEAMKAENIIITTIAVGDGADQEFLAHIADLSGGEFYEVRDPNLLPRVLIDSVQIINKPLLKEGDFTPVLGPAATVLAADAAGAPMLGGLVITAPRDDPRITMELFHPDGEPLLAHWQAGLGHVAAFTSDATGLWSAAWLRWAGYDAFWAQLVRTVARQGLGDGAELVATIRNDDLHLAFEAGDDAEGFLDYLQVDGVVYGANGRVQNVRLRQVAPGRYEASVPAPDAGNYIVALKPRRGDRLLSPLIGGASKTSSIEFSRTATNTALLREIAEQTGGRRLPIEQPDAADLYDRRDMPPSRSLLPFWRTLLLLALPLLLLDVAARRIAWDGPLVVQFARAMIARMTPARARGEQATATLAGLRRASDAVDERLAGESEGVTKLEGDGAFRAPARSAEATRTPADVAAAIDALRGRAATSRPDPAKDAPPTPTPDPEAGSTETARGLLAAKRRAQQRMRDG